MFLKELAEKNRVCFHKKFSTWEEAVAASCQPLLEDGSIEKEYVESVIACVKKYGPYIVFAPKIAMPHSQEGAVGVNRTEVSFMKVEEPVHFDENDPEKDAYLFFVLASAYHSEHIVNMQKLAQMLLTPGATEKLLELKSKVHLIRLDEELS